LELVCRLTLRQGTQQGERDWVEPTEMFGSMSCSTSGSKERLGDRRLGRMVEKNDEKTTAATGSSRNGSQANVVKWMQKIEADSGSKGLLAGV
jgi:hypothetical protein